MLVTKSHQANEPVQVSIDKEELKLIPAVANHPSLSDEANWYMSSVIYKHALGDARLAAGFKSDFTQTVDVPLKQNMVGGDVYELHEILVSGANRSPLISIKRSDIANASSMDLTLAGLVSQIYASWESWAGGPLSGDYTTIADGGVYGGWNQSWEWIRAGNISFLPNESGSVTFVTSSIPYYFGFGFGFGGQPNENIGFIKHSGADEILINDLGTVNNTPSFPINAGQNTFKLEKVGSTELKFYVNDQLFHTMANTTGQTLHMSLRNRYTAQGQGMLSAYKNA